MAPGVTRGRNMRSRYRCSMCPAIHINSRSWLRSSSTHEPSDPPPRVIFLLKSTSDSIRNVQRTTVGPTWPRPQYSGHNSREATSSPRASEVPFGRVSPQETGETHGDVGQANADRRGYPRSNLAELPVSVMILPQVHLRKPCYDFYFL